MPPHRSSPQSGGRRCQKFGIYPLTLPSPARGEGKHKKEIPSPLIGEGEGGGDLGGYFTASERERVRGKFLFSRFAGVSRVIRNY